MERNMRLVRIIVELAFVLLACEQATFGSVRPGYEQRRFVEAICSDINTPEKRAQAVAELINMVNDNNDVYLQLFAAEKLGDLGALEAKVVLENLAKSLEWTDSTRQLKRICALSYWKIRVVEEPNDAKQEALLMRLLRGKYDVPVYADVVVSWVIDELSNRGVTEALPGIVEAINSRISGKRAEQRIWLCTKKIELLSTNKSREEALVKALATKDLTNDQHLKRWAVTQLLALETEEGRSVLMGYAMELQSRYWDESGKWIGRRGDREAAYSGTIYRTIIRTLKQQGVTDDKIRKAGLRPDKYFLKGP